ncbi:MAG: ABC transporter ATP-binding protein [Lachnospiraceae bacterium]|nr:ABC transporter ATP-binding protein [Lachnospiraceae bacterium]
MIELKNVCAGYDGKTVLHDANVSFEPGKITVLVGPNGCGKSTLLKSLVRINPHSSGEILIGGVSIQKMDQKQLARNVAYLAQNKKAPDISVMKMVLHGRFAHLSYPRKYRQKDIEIAKNALKWAGMEAESEKIVSKLSGGMQQKVYIAMALAQDADTILMDEPTTYLDVVHQLRLMEMARQLAKAGKAVVMVLHDLTQALQIADQVVVLKEGKIIAQGTSDEIYESGSLQRAFGVEVERVHTKSGWHYLCSLLET